MTYMVLFFIVLGGGAMAQERPAPLAETAFAPFLTAQSFTCSRKTCGQMRSCAEACHALTVCGDTARDGDSDGIPGESLCGATRC